jgi:hypothetical protein
MACRQIKREIEEFLYKYFRTILEVWLFTNAVLGITLTNNQSRIVWLISVFVSFLILIVLTKMHKTLQEIEKPIKRFTRKNKDGDVIVDKERLHQALIYLSILEDQIEGK